MTLDYEFTMYEIAKLQNSYINLEKVYRNFLTTVKANMEDMAGFTVEISEHGCILFKCFGYTFRIASSFTCDESKPCLKVEISHSVDFLMQEYQNDFEFLLYESGKTNIDNGRGRYLYVTHDLSALEIVNTSILTALNAHKL